MSFQQWFCSVETCLHSEWVRFTSALWHSRVCTCFYMCCVWMRASQFKAVDALVPERTTENLSAISMLLPFDILLTVNSKENELNFPCPFLGFFPRGSFSLPLFGLPCVSVNRLNNVCCNRQYVNQNYLFKKDSSWGIFSANSCLLCNWKCNKFPTTSPMPLRWGLLRA